MSTYQMLPLADFRNEGWTLAGSGVAHLADAWSATGDDTKYAYNPANKGRAAVTFEQDISSVAIPDGSTIESVTVTVRAEKTDSATRTLTVNMLSADDTSNFSARTVALSGTPTTITVGTYTTDPLNRAWNKDTLNQLILQAFTYSNEASNKVRVYELYATVNFRTRPTVTITSPSGVVSTAAPTVAFTYAQADGDIQLQSDYKIFTAAQQAQASFNPDTTPPAYPPSKPYTVKSGDTLFSIAAHFLGDGYQWPTLYAASDLPSGNPDLIYPGDIVTIPGFGKIEGDIASFTLPFALAQDDYFLYLKVTSVRGAVSAWASKSFTVGSAAGSPGSPGGSGSSSLSGIGTGGGGAFESVIADSSTSNVYLSIRDGSNLLASQQADFENLVDSLEWTGVNCTPAQDLTTAFAGGGSVKAAATASGDVQLVSNWVEVPEETDLTIRLQAEAAATGRVVNVYCAFADEYFASTGTTATVAGADVTGTYTELVLGDSTTPVTTPLGTVQVQITIEVKSAASGEAHNFDHIGMMYGVGSAWSAGGHGSRNLLTAAQCSADEPVATEPYTAISGSTYSRVSQTGTGSDGLKCFKMLYNGVPPQISRVGVGTAYTATDSSASVTLNNPGSLADGDVLVALVSAESSGDTGVINQAGAPAGWTVVGSSSNGFVSLSVLIRDATAADPSTWTATLTKGATQVRKRAFVTAYRGAAASAYQFAQSAFTQSSNGSVNPVTATVFNGDPNAWRISGFGVQDDHSGGSMTANIAPAAVPDMQFVGKASATSGRDRSLLTYTFNRPANVQSGDLMIAAIQLCGNVTVNAPSGWRKVRAANGDSSIAILVRTAGSSEPNSWTGTVDTNGNVWVAQCVAYRYADDASNQFIADGAEQEYTATFNTPTITNTNGKAWRISIFGSSTSHYSSFTSTEVAERCDNTNGDSVVATVSISDSNGPVSTGDHETTAVVADDDYLNSANGWIGLIKPAASVGTPPANEHELQDATAGSANPWLTLAGYDSNDVAGTGQQTVYGTFTPGSGSGTVGTASFLGFLIPAASAGVPQTPGKTGAVLSQYVDIRKVSQDVLDRCGNQVTVQAEFLGSSVGTPHLVLYAYTGVELISTQVAEGTPFNTSVWQKSLAQFSLPQGTTRLKIEVDAVDRVEDDYVLWQRASIALGAETVYRPGTSGAAHPILDAPLVEFAEDTGLGYGDWTSLPTGSPLVYDNDTGLCTVIDQTMTPLSHRKYRARTQSWGLAGDVFTSDYGPESNEVTLIAQEWWLKDLYVPDMSRKIKVLVTNSPAVKTMTTDTSTVFQPLGASRPVVVTEGYKGDVIGPVWIETRPQDQVDLMALLASGHTLLLQSNLDKAWWVRPLGDIESDVQTTSDYNTNTLRFVSVTFVEVAPPEV